MSGYQCAPFAALGSTAVVAVSDSAALSRARTAVERTVASFDLVCSRFREDSELSALNRGSGEPVAASGLLLDAVDTALRAARLTDGDVDPTVGRALIKLGYDRDFAALTVGTGEASGTSISLGAVPGWRSVTLDRDAHTIQLARGVTLDLGATAKALAADRAARTASADAGCGVLVSLGGDISVAGPAPASGWRIRVTDDHRSEVSAPGQWITVRTGGLATSSTTTRRWQVGSQTAHHLLDPQSGQSVRGVWRTVSVAARSCLDANIASTAAIVRGERAVAWLESLALPSRLVSVEGAALHLAGWPGEGDDLDPLKGRVR